jgi:hypothetical protein
MAYIEGGISGQVQEVDSVSLASRVSIYGKDGNRISKKQRDFINDNQEFLIISGKNDSYATGIRTDRKGNILTGNYTPELIENFEGSSFNVQKWNQTTTTFSPTQSTASGYIFNNTSLTTANALHILQSQRLFYKHPRVPLQDKTRLRANIPTNSTADLGFGIPSGTTLIVPNGVSVRIVNGLWTATITSNNTELIAVNINDYLTGLVQLNTANLNSEFYVVDIIIDDDNMVVTVQNTQTGVMVGYAQLPVPLSTLKMFASTALPKYIRLFNSASAPATAPNITIAETQVLSLDMGINMDASQIASNLGLTSGRNPFTGVPLTSKVNNTVPATITLSNTTPGLTTPDGTFVFAAVAGSETDYLAVAWQIPVGLKFIFESVFVETINQVVSVATTPTQFEWFIGHNQSAASLATGNKITTMIGCQTFTVGKLAGDIANRISDSTTSGEVTESGRFVTLGFKMPTATATATETFRVTYRIKGRFI